MTACKECLRHMEDIRPSSTWVVLRLLTPFKMPSTHHRLRRPSRHNGESRGFHIAYRSRGRHRLELSRDPDRYRDLHIAPSTFKETTRAPYFDFAVPPSPPTTIVHHAPHFLLSPAYHYHPHPPPRLPPPLLPPLPRHNTLR